MPPRRRTRSARIESADDVVVVSLDDDEPPNTRRRRTEPGTTCCFPACNLPVGGGVSANSAYPTFTDENAKCCDRCNKIVLADRLACTHPGFPQRECIHPKDPKHACSFINKPENMEKWKEWATFRESGKLRLEVSQLIGESLCLRCAGAFVERCNVLLHVSDGNTRAYRENVKEMVCKVFGMLIHPTISSQGRTGIVQTLFVDWWNSDRMRLSSSRAFTSHADLVEIALRYSYSFMTDQGIACLAVLSEENIQWWSTCLLCDFADDGDDVDLTLAFRLMIKDMKRALEHLSGSDAEHLRSSYVMQIADMIKSYLYVHNGLLESARPDDEDGCPDDFVPMTIEEIERCPYKTDFQKYIENCKDDWSQLGGHCILDDVANAIDFPKTLIELIELIKEQAHQFREILDAQSYPLGHVRKLLWLASLCTDRCLPVCFGRSRVKEQMYVIQLLFESIDQNESTTRLYLSTILDILVKRFPPFVINPIGFAMGVAQGIKFAEQSVPDTAPILKVFLDNIKMRSRSRVIDPAFYGFEQLDDHVIRMWVSSGDLYTSYKIDHSQLMQSMLHAWAFDGSSLFFDRDVAEILFPKATDFQPEIREHENFWIPENTKKVALKSTRSFIDEYKEEIPDGVYLSMMNSLMTQWHQD